MSQARKFQPGDRIRVAELINGDDGVIQVGMTGTIVRMRPNRVECVVDFDGRDLVSTFHGEHDGYLMTVAQIELISSETKPEPAQPSASYVLSNAELQAAIDRTFDMVRRSAFDAELSEHMSGLLKIQMARASKESAP